MTEQQQTELAAINSRIDRLEVTLSHAVDAIEKMATVVNKPVKTNWGAIAAWVSVVIAMGGALYMPMYWKISEQDLEIKTLRDQMIATKDERIARAEEQRWDLLMEALRNGSVQQVD